MKKVIVGMSGGVDSTVTALLLKKKGYEVLGVTLKLWDEASRCCNYEDILDAKKACWKIGIRHYVLNYKAQFRKKVVDYFIKDYLEGRTPNPCAVCNDAIKFEALLKKMKELDFDHIATGHYALIEKKGKNWFLKKAKDKTKTQEYFLSRLKKEYLPYILFPLGNMVKTKVRQLAAKEGFNAGRKESQEACFLRANETPYEFIARSMDVSKIDPGYLYSDSGEKLKKLDFAYFKYTVGQRKGLNYSAGRPVFVTTVDAKEKKVVVGDREKAMKKSFGIRDLNMYYDAPVKPFTVDVKIRYLHKPVKARIEIKGDEASIDLAEPQFAVTPGQLAVIYNKNIVLGSGFII